MADTENGPEFGIAKISGLPSGEILAGAEGPSQKTLRTGVSTMKHTLFPSGLTGLSGLGVQTDSISGGLGSWLTTGPQSFNSKWTPSRLAVARTITARGFKLLMVLIILFNIGVVVRETDIRARGGDVPTTLTTMNMCLVIFYLVELFMRLYAFRSRFFSRWSNCFDFFVVFGDTMSVCWNALTLGSTAPSISMFRILRLGRMLRVFRVFVVFRELSMLIHGLTSAFKAILWATVMIALVLLIWSILAVEWIHPVVEDILRDENSRSFQDCSRCSRAFSSVPHAMLTFMQTIIAGDSWGLLAVPIIEKEPYLALIFLGALVCVELGLLNLILAVIVDRAQEARKEDVELVLSEKAERFKHEKVRLLRLCMSLDRDSSGYLTLEELMNGFDTQPEFADLLRYINITKHELAMFYHVLDVDNSGSISYKEFVEQLYMMKTQETKTLMLYNLQSMRREFYEHMQDMKMHFASHVEKQNADQSEKIFHHIGVATGLQLQSPASTLQLNPRPVGMHAQALQLPPCLDQRFMMNHSMPIGKEETFESFLLEREIGERGRLTVEEQHKKLKPQSLDQIRLTLQAEFQQLLRELERSFMQRFVHDKRAAEISKSTSSGTTGMSCTSADMDGVVAPFPRVGSPPEHVVDVPTDKLSSSAHPPRTLRI